MKANEAPEKIYLFENPIDGTADYRWLSKRSCSDDVEYIRTDAFIKKAEKAMIEWAGTYISKTTGGGVKERKALANDLLSYFKNYMKGDKLWHSK